MVQCTECGARNSEESTFCVRCGAAMVASAGAVESPPGSDTDRIDPVRPESPAESEPEPQVERTLVMEPVAEEQPSAEALLAQAADLMGDGEPDEAAARCREAIRLAPDMVAAYSLLGMAEEQRGNPIAAAGAYRRVLQLDPGRSVEREKLELLYSSGVDRHHAPGPERGGEAGEVTWARKWAPVLVGVGGAFLFLMILTGIILRVHAARAAERSYEESMAAAEASLDERDYDAAMCAFESALAARPDDPDAQAGLEYAQRKVSAARSTANMTAQATAPLAPIVPSGGPNPFDPVPIGPISATDMPTAAQTTQTTPPSRAPRPPIVNSQTPIRGTSTTPTPGTGEGPIPFIDPLEDDPDGGRGTPAEGSGAPPPETTDTQPPRDSGEITIWITEPERSTTPPAGGQSTPTTSTQGRRAGELRQQGDRLRAAGQCQQAAAAYTSAIEAYRAQSEADPATRDANQAAIRACEAALGVCQSSRGQ